MAIHDNVPVNEAAAPRYTRNSKSSVISVELNAADLAYSKKSFDQYPQQQIPLKTDEQGYKFIPANRYMWVILILVILITIAVAGFFMLWSHKTYAFKHLYESQSDSVAHN
uniref:Uncharacterized protein n=1 Tax=Acrobeloides nanus TaxID=290746 RepID=A0A914CB05_9BILA